MSASNPTPEQVAEARARLARLEILKRLSADECSESTRRDIETGEFVETCASGAQSTASLALDAAALALAQQALAEWVSREDRLAAFRRAVFAGSCRLPHTKAQAEADALCLLKLED